MVSLETLKTNVKSSCEHKGHNMGNFKKTLGIFSACCKACAMSVYINQFPDGLNREFFGTALENKCPMKTASAQTKTEPIYTPLVRNDNDRWYGRGRDYDYNYWQDDEDI